MKVRRAKWLLAISFSGRFSSAPVVGLRTVTIRLTPQVVNILLMATLYFCELINGKSFPFRSSRPAYFATRAWALALRGTRTTCGRSPFVFCGIYSIAPLMILAGVIAMRSATRHPIRH